MSDPISNPPVSPEEIKAFYAANPRLTGKEETPPNIECCTQCGQPKNHPNQQAGDEVAQGWPSCENPSCVAFGQPTASAWYRPAPQPSSSSEITEAIDDLIRKAVFRGRDGYGGSRIINGSYEERQKEVDAARRRLESLYREQRERISELEVEVEEMDENDVLQVLCRVFDDDTPELMEEWRAWYKPEQWLHSARGLGAFIFTRLQAERSSLKDSQLTPEEAEALIESADNDKRRNYPAMLLMAMGKLRALSTKGAPEK